MESEEKSLRNSKFMFDGAFLSIYSHLFKKLELSRLCRKTSYEALKIPKIAFSKKSPYLKISKKKYFISFRMLQDYDNPP